MIFMILSIGICRIRCSEKYTENRSFVGVLRIVTKTLQNESRQLRTDRNLLRNSTDRPKNKACVTGSDSFRKRANRTLSRSRERNPKTGTDNHDIGNQHRRATCLAVLHRQIWLKTNGKNYVLKYIILRILSFLFKKWYTDTRQFERRWTHTMRFIRGNYSVQL